MNKLFKLLLPLAKLITKLVTDTNVAHSYHAIWRDRMHEIEVHTLSDIISGQDNELFPKTIKRS